MRHAVIIHYPECDTEDEVAVFTTTATRSELLNALERAKEDFYGMHIHDRIDCAYWVCRKAAELVGGTWGFVATDTVTIDIEEPEG